MTEPQRARGWTYSLRGVAAALSVVVAFAAHSQPAGGGLSGTWLLVEQTYGKGGSSLAAADEPLRLRVTRTEAGYAAWIWRGDDSASGRAWPALVAEGRELPAVSRSVAVEAAGTVLHARYEVVPVAGEELVLAIDESYALSADGRFLTGTVDVRFQDGGTQRGGYTLYRRFEREK